MAQQTITVIVGRFGESTKKVKVPANATVKQVLEEAGLSVSGSEKVWLGGEKAKLSANKLQNGTILNVVGSRAGGI